MDFVKTQTQSLRYMENAFVPAVYLLYIAWRRISLRVVIKILDELYTGPWSPDLTSLWPKETSSMIGLLSIR
jgi:hypothetical protein